MVDVKLDPGLENAEELAQLETIKRTSGSDDSYDHPLLDVREVENEITIDTEGLKLLYYEHQMFNELYSPIKLDILRYIMKIESDGGRTVSTDELLDAVANKYEKSTLYEHLRQFRDQGLVKKEGQNRYKYVGQFPHPNIE